ncbi:MAG: hypothetical protein JL50_13445 [Peptococcaceae bacterium BICA1-7]|nr:MAG: hypothetical protein JL50_13445 [Peptococcaceae bacterium BICA1-7]HBV99539.1 hypothetical protein [Desulfotomaculum sp.]
MIDLLLTVFRYIFLLILFVFIFQLIKMVFRDIKHVQPGGASLRAGPAEIAVQDLAPLPGAAAGLAVLVSSDPGLPSGNVYPLKSGEELTLGRGGRNDIFLTGPYSSVEHAAFFGKDGQFWLEDRGSKNGTYLNDIRIDKPTVLADGDRIKIGDVTMQFVRWSYEVESGNRSGPYKEAKRG